MISKLDLDAPTATELPKVGDKVTPIGKSVFVTDLSGLIGKVVDVLNGACGPILAVQFPERPGQTFDLFWTKIASV